VLQAKPARTGGGILSRRKPGIRLDFHSPALHRAEDVQNVVAPRKAPFGSMRPCLSQSRGNQGGGDRLAILSFALRFERRLRLNQLVGRRPLRIFSGYHGLIDTTHRDRVGGWRSDDYKATTGIMLSARESTRKPGSCVQQTTHKRQNTCENRLYGTFMASIAISS
jgi:hypothetical protein